MTRRELDGQDPRAANSQGSQLAAQGAVADACVAFQRAIDSGHLKAAPLATVKLANLPGYR